MPEAALRLLDQPAAETVPAHSTILPLETRNLSFEAGGRRLIDGIDLRLDAGTRTVIIGPNGAGKSLFLRLLHGLIEPSTGDVLWHGQPARPATRRRQAMVFQRPVLLRRSVSANMRHALRANGWTRRDARDRAAAWLARADLSYFADQPARLLSGGEQQRLAVARALSLEPDVLFLDEPTASLDPASTLGIEAMIQSAADAGTKIVLVTHDLGQARRFADEVVFLYRGRLEAFDSAATFFGTPGSEKAKAFIDGRIVL
jgi:tungstate transport system ATP-binding protein